MKLRTSILGAALLLVSAGPALGQGCAMCYSSAAGSGQAGQKALRRGVAILLVPTTGFVWTGLLLAFRYCRKRDAENA